MKLNILLLFICGLISYVQSASILFYFGLASYSHRISVWPLVTNLADRGHDVTFAGSHRAKEMHKHPKVREFIPKGFEKSVLQSKVFNVTNLIGQRIENGRFQGGGADLPAMGLEVCQKFLEDPETKIWAETSKFDVIIIDGLFNDCGFGLAHKFKSKIILFGTSTMFTWWYDAYGIPNEGNWIPDAIVSFPMPMTFFQRVISGLLVPVSYFYKVWFFYPELDKLLREELKIPNMPSVREIEKQTDLVIMNTHFSEEFARSLPPMVVSVGGLHILEAKEDKQKIPADMAKFIAEVGDDGFIYVSFGSVATISNAPQQIIDTFINAFKMTKSKFIWKWELERPAEVPSNVFTSKWVPQQLLLSHPKIKAFVTHSGLMSLSEAVINGVPVIMFPIFAEQDYNAFRFETAGRGIRLEIATVTPSELSTAFNEVRTNPKYKASMVKTMKLFKDRPMKAVDTAVWWTEYIIRNEDVSALKPLAINQTWYERRLLDVWAFIFVVLIVTLFLPLFIIKKLVVCIFCRGSDKLRVQAGKSSSGSKKVKRS